MLVPSNRRSNDKLYPCAETKTKHKQKVQKNLKDRKILAKKRLARHFSLRETRRKRQNETVAM